MLQPVISTAVRDCRQAFWGIAAFSAVVNLLMLTGPLYMLQVYDRVLASRSVPTLLALSVFLVGAYSFQGVLDLIRSRIVVRTAALFDAHLAPLVHRAVVELGARSRSAAEAIQPIRDLDQIRSFMTSSGPIAFVDLPWMPFFLGICFLIHPWLGYLSLAGGLVLLVITILTQRASRAYAGMINDDNAFRAASAEANRRNSTSVVSMGMATALGARLANVNDRLVATIGQATDVVNFYGTVTKTVRLVLQSAILGLGAYLVLKQEITAGAMIAASLMMGRALAPIEIMIANWRGFLGARESLKRLAVTATQFSTNRDITELPVPSSSLQVEHVTVVAPGTTAAIVANVSFRLVAGDVCGIVGPNGSGKSSLARVLTGVWPPARGTVRIDGATLHQWNSEMLGRHIGYVSQTVELFHGTVAENIARMSTKLNNDAVLQAAAIAGVHDMILRLPSGYDTVLAEGEMLSVGQRQRIALARALYGDPFLVLLDEPSANLDGEGEAALQQAIKALKARGAIVILVVHRRSALAMCDQVLALFNGTQQAFGPRDEVLRKLAARPSAPAAAATNLKVVRETSREDGR